MRAGAASIASAPQMFPSRFSVDGADQDHESMVLESGIFEASELAGTQQGAAASEEVVPLVVLEKQKRDEAQPAEEQG